MTTRDGPFLQHILVERFHVNQETQDISGTFPLAACAAKLWPLRTIRHLKAPIVEGMAPIKVGEGIMDSRRSDPAAEGLRVLGLRPARIAGFPGFCADYEFRLAPVENLDGAFHVNYRGRRWTRYRSESRPTGAGFAACCWSSGSTDSSMTPRNGNTSNGILERSKLSSPP